MRTLTLLQGSPEWLAHRRTTRNASDAPAMMGASPYVSRAELVRRVATGIEPEIDAATQARFNRGHEVEPALRALAEKIIGEDLYPVTGVSDDGYLGASLDGVDLAETIIFEAKQHNAEKRAQIAEQVIPPADYWQIVQQFAVCTSATQCLYLCGDGSESNTAQLWVEREQIEADIPKLIAGWAQFDADVAAYAHEEVQHAPVAAPVVGFGTLSMRVEGRVLASNLDTFKADADAFLARLPKPAELETDQDFADADAAVKACEEAESRIKAATDAALGQMTDVDALIRTAKSIGETIRSARLALDKAVKAEKDNRRAQIVQRGVDAVNHHYRTINSTLGEYALTPPASLRADIAAAIKGRKTISSLNDAVDGAVASEKIEASQTAERVRANIAILSEDAAGFESLFADRRQLVASKMPDDLRNLVKARIAEHQQREAERLEAERERVRKEEAAKLARQQQEEADRADRERALQEQAAADSSHGTASSGGVADSGEVPDRVRHLTGSGSHVQGDGAPGAGGLATAAAVLPSGLQITLGEIKEWIAPLSIDAAGLASLGFKPAASKGAAKLYAADDFAQICGALARLIAEAPARAAQKKAA